MVDFIEDERHDTIVDVPVIRRRRPRRLGPVGGPEVTAEAPALRAVGGVGNPGDTLARSPLSDVRLREAIVRRNHELKCSKSQAPAPPRPSAVHVGWARSSSERLTLRARGAGRIEAAHVEGPAPRTGAPDLFSVRSAPPAPTVSLSVEGQIFLVPVFPGDGPRTVLERLHRRLSTYYQCEITEENSGTAQLILRPQPPSHT